MTAKPEKPEQPSTQDKPTGVSEDTKAKFRAALDKKHAHAGKTVSEDGDPSKVHSTQGPAKQQMFRRKSGG